MSANEGWCPISFPDSLFNPGARAPIEVPGGPPQSYAFALARLIDDLPGPMPKELMHSGLAAGSILLYGSCHFLEFANRILECSAEETQPATQCCQEIEKVLQSFARERFSAFALAQLGSHLAAVYDTAGAAPLEPRVRIRRHYMVKLDETLDRLGLTQSGHPKDLAVFALQLEELYDDAAWHLLRLGRLARMPLAEAREMAADFLDGLYQKFVLRSIVDCVLDEAGPGARAVYAPGDEEGEGGESGVEGDSTGAGERGLLRLLSHVIGMLSARR